MRVSAVGVATAVFGVLLIVGAWLYTIERVRTERAEAVTSEFSKNANLALALDLQTNQLLKGIDQLLLVIKNQYEQPTPRVPISTLIPPGMSSERWITFIGVTDERGDLVESLRETEATNFSDRQSFRAHQRRDSNALLISPPVLGLVSGRWAITLTRRRNHPDGSFGGVVHVAIEPRYLTELFETTTLGPSDVMSLVLENGITLARRRGAAIEFGENIAKSQLVAEHAKNPSGNYIGPGGVDGKLRVFSYRTMKDYPVIVTVGTSAADAFALVERRARTYYLTASFASAFIALACTAGLVLLARQQRANLQLGEQASLLDKAQDAIMVSDLNRRLTYWNKGAERLYGWTAAEAIGRVASELFYGSAEPDESRAAYDQVLRTGEWTGELQPLNKSGRRVIIESRWTLVRDPGGKEQGILSINTDVTERRELEQQFLRAQRLESIGTLAGGIAHDLNNVFTPIMLGVEMLKQDVKDADGREVLDTVLASVRRGADMVRQVLTFARGMEGRRVELDARDLVADVARIARDTMPKNIDIKTRVDDGLPVLYGDPTQFHQVLLNLCVNARDAMPRGGLLTIAAERVETHPRDRTDVPAGVYVMLQVEDTGTGIHPDVADKIFDPFFTTKEPGKGTGLGLSTSLTIVKSHGGHIRASSVPGRGASFRIYLPVTAGPGPESAPAAAADQPKGAGETVLVVDDEPAIRLLAQRTLEAQGYRVLLAGDGAEAIAIFRAQYESIALVMLDMTMPVLDGVPTIQALARIDPAVRIIASSGIHGNEQAARAASPRVTQFMPKPFTADILLRAIRQALA
jgi:two-component system cell cycle sensor histidine kinase/response regulator CckA